MQRFTVDDVIIIKYWRKSLSSIQQARIHLNKMVIPKIRLYYRKYDDIDYVVFGGMVVMELTAFMHMFIIYSLFVIFYIFRNKINIKGRLV